MIVGFSIAALLYVASWYINASQMQDHMKLMNTSELASKKMNVIANLVEISQQRIRLSHQLILTEDYFDKDDISQKISALASEFILKRSELQGYKLNDDENMILKNQRTLYPIIINNLRKIIDLSQIENAEANNKAKDILFNKVVPTQGLLIDGFMELMNICEAQINRGSVLIKQKHEVHKRVRNTLFITVMLVSLLVVFVVTNNILKIEKGLYELSMVDALTGVCNRRFFDEKIQYEWKRALRTERCLSLLLVDIDYFKKYNDMYGHEQGDICLSRVASTLVSAVHRSEDIVSRYGGEEFAIILPNVDKEGARKISKRLLEKIHDARIPHSGSDVFKYITISIGQASLQPSMSHSYNELFRAADHALYQSKESGRNRATTYYKQGNKNNIKVVDFS